MFMSKRQQRMLKWMDQNPLVIYADYNDTISDEQANKILQGDFNGFYEDAWEMEFNLTDYSGAWDYWEQEFCDEFDYESWSDVPESVKEFCYECRWFDTNEFWETCIRNWSGHVVAILMKRDGEYIYAPENHWGSYGDDRERLAKYIKRAFGFEGGPREVCEKLEIIYGGYGREHAIICGSVDLLEIWKSREVPKHIWVDSKDSDNLIWYEFTNGCGNLGGLKINNRKKFKAKFVIDGQHYGYSVDDCYGFTGSYWSHKLEVV